MPSGLPAKLERINGRLVEMIAEAKRSLTGEGDFGVEQVRALSASIAEMAPVMASAAELRAAHPELNGEFDRYKLQLGELHLLLQHIHMMLLARRGQMDARRDHLQSVSQWAGALQLTRP